MSADARLAACLGGLSAASRNEVTWGAARLEVTGYLGPADPPDELVTSVRCVLFRGDEVLVLRNRDGFYHVVPGGRREPGEALDQALRRELLEETGWTASAPRVIGLIRFRHLTPRPEGYAYPYPEFVQVVYAAEATGHDPAARQPDDYEVECAFRPVAEARALPLELGNHTLLEAALLARGLPGA